SLIWNMKKIIIIVAIVLVLGGFVVFQKLRSNEPAETTEEVTNTTINATPDKENTKGTTNYKDGVYTGVIGSASQYGDVQVKVTIKGGKITNIDFVKVPDQGGGHTMEVNDMALPILKQET